MNRSKILVYTILLLGFTYNLQAQTTETEKENTLSLDKGTLDSQFEYIMQESGNYQDFKVVKIAWLNTLRAHVADSLKKANALHEETKSTIDTQDKEISQLKTNLSDTENTLLEMKSEKDTMSFFGLAISKTLYSMVLWLIILGLIIALLVFIYKFRNSNTLTKQAQDALAETTEEYETHRRNALEREQKVRRQLVDEINKNKGGK